MTTKEGLEAARRLITKPEDWCQGDFYSGGACCALGALKRVGAHGSERNLLREVMGTHEIGWYNDSHSHECVLAAFDAAIERCEP